MTDRELIQKLIELRERANQRRSRLRASQPRPPRIVPPLPESRPTSQDGRVGCEGERGATVPPSEPIGEASIAVAASDRRAPLAA